MKLKNIIKNGLRILGALFFISTSNCIKYDHSPVSYGDYTGDSIADYVINDAENKRYIAFIGKKDGSYEKADIRMQDGHPFYFTEKGYYDSWGNYFSNESTEKLNQRTREILKSLDK